MGLCIVPCIIATIVLVFSMISINAILVKFTNVECITPDKTFCTIRHCILKVVGRHRIALNIHVNMLKVPVNNITVNAQLLHKSYDYRPFLYNITTDFCAFFKNGHKFLFWKLLLDIARPYTNVNHTCPYNHDIIVKNFILQENMFQYIPFPSGFYMIRFHVYIYNELKGKAQIYFSIKE